jgi:hypothetical protein
VSFTPWTLSHLLLNASSSKTSFYLLGWTSVYRVEVTLFLGWHIISIGLCKSPLLYIYVHVYECTHSLIHLPIPFSFLNLHHFVCALFVSFHVYFCKMHIILCLHIFIHINDIVMHILFHPFSTNISKTHLCCCCSSCLLFLTTPRWASTIFYLMDTQVPSSSPTL